MKTTRIVVLTAATIVGSALFVCLAMWNHMTKQAAAGLGHHLIEQTNLVKPWLSRRNNQLLLLVIN